MSDNGFRMEHALPGDLPVPAEACYGVRTTRADFCCGQLEQGVLKGMEGACQELSAAFRAKGREF